MGAHRTLTSKPSLERRWMRGGSHWSDAMRCSTQGGDNFVTTYRSPSLGLKQMTFVYVSVLMTFRKSCLSSLDLTSQNGNREGCNFRSSMFSSETHFK